MVITVSSTTLVYQQRYSLVVQVCLAISMSALRYASHFGYGHCHKSWVISGTEFWAPLRRKDA